MGTRFARVAAVDWQFASALSKRRKGRLQNVTYEQIIARIVETARIESIKRKYIGRGSSRCVRIQCVIRVSPSLVDAFHNSPAGYRAQYYQSISNGNRANAFAVRQLTPMIIKFLSRLNGPDWTGSWIEKSLQARGAKVWIHQGRWLRENRMADRYLNIARWRGTTRGKWRTAKLRKWGQLAPEDECRIVVKGGYIRCDGSRRGLHAKERRGWEIAHLGFT